MYKLKFGKYISDFLVLGRFGHCRVRFQLCFKDVYACCVYSCVFKFVPSGQRACCVESVSDASVVLYLVFEVMWSAVFA